VSPDTRVSMDDTSTTVDGTSRRGSVDSSDWRRRRSASNCCIHLQLPQRVVLLLVGVVAFHGGEQRPVLPRLGLLPWE